MKILHLFNEIKFSGAEIMYANAAPKFREKKLQLYAFSTGKNIGEFVEKFEKANIIVFHKPIQFIFFSINGWNYYRHFYTFLIEKKITVLHIHRSDLYFAAVLARMCGVKVIKTQHNTFKNRPITLPFAIIQRYILRTTGVTFQTIGSSVHQNELINYRNPSVRVNNWFDSSRFYPAASDEEKYTLRKKLGINENSFVIISTGGCSKIKNHYDIIKALSIVRAQMHCTYLHLGKGVTECDEQKLAESMGLGDSIKFMGNQNNVREYLISSDVYVMPSQFEGLGNAAIEAMACKIPSILYNCPGLRDLITDNDNGYLIEPNYQILATTILDIAKNPDVGRNKAEHALSNVMTNHSIENGVFQMMKIYNS